MLKVPLKRLALMFSVAGILVFASGAMARGQATTQTPGSRAKAAAKVALDLNAATAQELQELPGVGEATARKIVAGRPYSRIDDLAKAGVPARTVDGIRSLVRVGAASAKGKARAIAAPIEKSAGKVNVNTAEIAELESLPGVGAAIAKAIVAGRPWKSVADLEKIRGLGSGPRFERLRELITIDGAAAAGPASKVAAGRIRSARDVLKSVAVTKGMTRLAPGQKVNINSAAMHELDMLPGIGPVKAQAIIDARPFKTIEDIMKVRGIKQGEFARIKDIITVK